MGKQLKIGFLILGVLFFSLLSYAIVHQQGKVEHKVVIQEPQNDLPQQIKIKKRLSEVLDVYQGFLQKYHASGKINIKNTKDSTSSSSDFSIEKSGDELFYRLGLTKLYTSEGYAVRVDDEGKQIFVNKMEVPTEQGFISKTMIAQLLREGEVEYQSELTGEKETITITNVAGIDFISFTLVFNPQTLYPITIINVTPAAGEYLDSGFYTNTRIDFKTFDLNPLKPENYSNIIHLNGKKWEVRENYRNYELHIF